MAGVIPVSISGVDTAVSTPDIDTGVGVGVDTGAPVSVSVSTPEIPGVTHL
jgi:hypothetical protein